jgi:catechol 2,3-dioxygenase-like lactoylglutathione lyase family enzyme
MARIRYVAAMSRDPDALAGFYTDYLEMKELGRSAEGDVSLTDGLYNLTLFRKREGLGELSTRRGLHHIGLQVENLGEARARYQKFNPRGLVVREPDDIHHGAIRIFDPECNPVTLSEEGFGVDEERRFPRLAHVAFNALDPEMMLNFYVQVLGLREVESSYVRRREGKLNHFCGDGSTNLAIHPFFSSTEGHERRFGVNHVGFLVSDLARTLDELGGVVAVKARPANRPYAEFRFRDPEDNALDLSQTKGWEVDVDKWERAA